MSYWYKNSPSKGGTTAENNPSEDASQAEVGRIGNKGSVMALSFDYGSVMNPEGQARRSTGTRSCGWPTTKGINARYISLENVFIRSEIAMPMGYAGIGFHQSHLEVGLDLPGPLGQRKITLRAIPLPTGAVCGVSGCLRSSDTAHRCVRQVFSSAEKGELIETAIGIPDSLCRSSISRDLRLEQRRPRTAVEEGQDPQGVRVEFVSPDGPPSVAQSGLIVSAYEQALIPYADLFSCHSVQLSRIAPLYIARYNFVVDRFSESLPNPCLLVWVYEASCEIALWSGKLPLYQERLLRDGEVGVWIRECQSRVTRIALRAEGDCGVIVRGIHELSEQLSAGLQACRVVSLPRMKSEIEGCLVDVDISLFQGGFFDVALGLLAQLRRAGERVSA